MCEGARAVNSRHRLYHVPWAAGVVSTGLSCLASISDCITSPINECAYFATLDCRNKLHSCLQGDVTKPARDQGSGSTIGPGGLSRPPDIHLPKTYYVGCPLTIWVARACSSSVAQVEGAYALVATVKYD